MDSKYKRLISNSAWSFAGNAGSKIVSFLLLPLYTKWLGTEGYGFSDLITTYSALFGGIITLCISDAILFFVKGKDVCDKKSYFSSAINTALFFFIIWGVIAFALSLLNIQGKFIINNIFFIYGMIVTNFLQTSSQQMALALDKIRVYSFSGLVLCLSIFLFSWLLIPRMGVAGYVLAMILANILTSLYSVLCSGALHYYSFTSTSFVRAKELLKYSIPLIPNTVMWWLVSSLNRPLMESSLGLSSVGLFAVANKFPAIITLLFSVFSVTWTVSVIEEYGKPNFDDFYKKIYRFSFSVTVIGSLIFILLSKYIIHLFTAPEFHEAYKYMTILIVGAVLSCMSSYFGTCFGVVKQTKYFFYSSLWGSVSAILLNYLLIPRFAIYGAVISVALSFLVMAISRYIYSLKYVKAKLIPLTVFYVFVLGIAVMSVLFIDSFVIQCLVVMVCIGGVVIIEKDSILMAIGILKNRIKGGKSSSHGEY